MGVPTQSVAAVLGLGLLGSLVAAGPASAHPSTTVTLNVEGCENCVFVVHNGKNPDRAWDAVTTTAPVVNGQTTFRVRSKITPYISLEVRHPEEYSSENAVPFVAFGWKKYRHIPGWHGEICWGRREGRTATRHIVVTQYLGHWPPDYPAQTFIRARLARLPVRAEAGVNGTPVCP